MATHAFLRVAIWLAVSSWSGLTLADTTTTKLTEPTPTIGHRFGHSVAFSSDQLLVGVSGINEVQIFDKTTGVWKQSGTLKPSGVTVSGFGSALAADADRVVVGATRSDASVDIDGRVFVFERSGSTLVQTAVLAPADSTGAESFGLGVALDGNTIAAYGYEKIYVFTGAGAIWTPQGALSSAQSPPVGHRLALDGDVLVAANTSLGSGVVHVFARNAGAWTFEKALTPSEETDFGRAVSLDGDTLAIGSSIEIQTYDRAGGAWTPKEKFGSVDVEELILRGDTVLAGEYYSGAQVGVTTLWAKSGGTWLRQTEASGGNALAWLGNRFAIGRVWASGVNWVSDNSGSVTIVDYAGAATGATCAQQSDCTSGWCVDGVCCEEACGGVCTVCALTAGASTNGKCTVAAGPSCCLDSTDCGPAPRVCTENWCIDTVCTAKPITDCCLTHDECDDGASCTEDSCVDGKCVNQPMLQCPGAGGSGGSASGGAPAQGTGTDGGCGCRSAPPEQRSRWMFIAIALALGFARSRKRRS